MKDWIPLLQSLIWPLFAATVLLWFRRSFEGILGVIADRIREGAGVEAGPSGLKLSEVQSPRAMHTPSGVENAAAAALRSTEVLRPGPLPHAIYMTHHASRDRTLDREGLQYYQLRISLDADEPQLLDDVDHVVYHLHPTFPSPDRTANDRRTQFEIQIGAWGEFNMTADVHFRDGRAPLTIERYLNFLPRA